jgi:hypothetical protein
MTSRLGTGNVANLFLQCIDSPLAGLYLASESCVGLVGGRGKPPIPPAGSNPRGDAKLGG